MPASDILADLAVLLSPVGDRIAVLPDENETRSEGDIIIPDTAEKEPKQMGSILAMGAGMLGDECIDPTDHFEIDDRVMFGKYVGDDVKIKRKDGTTVKVKILHADSVLAICNPK